MPINFLWEDVTQCGFNLFVSNLDFSANYDLNIGDQITISSSDINETRYKHGSTATWMFNTSVELRIRVVFVRFNLRDPVDFIDIGDGPLVDEEGVRFKDNQSKSFSMLASFSGNERPANVTSLCNAAWVRLRAGKLFSKLMSKFTIQVLVIHESGKIFLTLSYLNLNEILNSS